MTAACSNTVLLSSGMGSMLGAFFFGRLADRIGRRPLFLQTITFFYFAAWYVVAALTFLFLGIETRGASIETIDHELLGETGGRPVMSEAQP